ncbi:MAG: response regulator transcription factor [Pyrinomonadaceae bacterium]|nr:response regulator transcription factor [Phycisphaerales bacterium]
MNERIKVLLVDDDFGLRTAWEKLIRTQKDMELVCSLDRADEVVSIALDTKAQVVLLDLTMGGRDPLEVVAELVEQSDAVRVVVYSGHSDQRTVQLAIDAGAWGFADKLDPPLDVLETLRVVARGEVVFPRGRASRPLSPEK